jgi:hypothetical protein
VAGFDEVLQRNMSHRAGNNLAYAAARDMPNEQKRKLLLQNPRPRRALASLRRFDRAASVDGPQRGK